MRPTPPWPNAPTARASSSNESRRSGWRPVFRSGLHHGTRVGDYILTAGGVEIDSSRTLLRVRRQYHVGEELPMTLLRDGTLLETALLLSQGVE